MAGPLTSQTSFEPNNLPETGTLSKSELLPERLHYGFSIPLSPSGEAIALATIIQFLLGKWLVYCTNRGCPILTSPSKSGYLDVLSAQIL
jgi:hypothetical protein